MSAPKHGWAMATMMAINRLTPNITGKAFDPDWFVLRERLESAGAIIDSMAGIHNPSSEVARLRRCEQHLKHLMQLSVRQADAEKAADVFMQAEKDLTP